MYKLLKNCTRVYFLLVPGSPLSYPSSADSVVRTASVKNILDNTKSLPFTTRSAWIDIQSDCPDLQRTHAHLKQGTRLSKKVTNVKDVKGKKISNDQELMQSDPTSCPQNQKGNN